MKVELGQFYLYKNTVYVFTRENEQHLSGTAFSKGMGYTTSIPKTVPELYDFLPIDPAIAKMIQSATPIDTPLE